MYNGNFYRMLQLVFPCMHILEPRLRIRIAEGFLARGKHRIVVEGLLAGVRHRVQEIIFVFHFLADVFLGYVRGKADGFFGILHRVRNGPITSPAPHQSIVVGVGNGFASHDVLHARGEYFVFQRLVKECLDEEVAVAGIKCVASPCGRLWV